MTKKTLGTAMQNTRFKLVHFMSLCIPESICYKNGSFLKDTKTKGNDGKIFLSRLNACAAIHFQPQILKTGVCACVCVCVGVGFPIASNKV